MSLDEKLKILSKKGACYSCLTKSNHISRQCDLKSKLRCNFCSLSHYNIMCSKKLDKHLSVKNSPSTITLSNQCSRDRTVYLQTLCVIARGRGRERRIRIILDSASQYSHVSERLIPHLGLIPHRYENIIHSLFGGTQTKPKKHGVYSIELTALNGDYSCCLEVLSEEKICDSVPKITDEQILNNLRELNIEFSDSFSEDLEIDLLVGSNVLGRILMKKCCELDSGLSVVETKLGNTVIGMLDDVCHIDRNVMTTLSMYVRNFKLTDLWSLESLGISNPTLEESKQNSYEDALNDFQQKLAILPNGRYELQLPWKHDPVNLPDNKGLTWARHEKVIKRAESNGFLREYQKVFEDWENLGIIEIVPEEEVKAVKCHYLAHRPVIKLQSETTKYRPCFDGSACENGKPSLNQCLYKGINLLEVIPDILDRFRLYPIGLSADIEKAFLMLSVHPKDRDYLRFFYPSKEELVYRHCRIVFGLNSSPFLLNASIKHLLDNAPLEYSSKLLSKGCFNLRGWQSNVASKYVSQHTGEASVLGILWNLDKDTLRCNINFEILTCETKITKRFILSTVQKVFDANGLLSPATLPPKLLLQETWKLKLPWDSELPKNIVNKFMKWSNEMYLLKEVTVPRYIAINETSELHIFVDASKSSYGACVFVRTVVENDVKVTLLRSKARVAPLKSLTIPRLELMSCCLGARLANSIIRALNLPGIKVIYWSDSEVALWWIREQGNWSVFVANRVKEIRELTQFQSWRHVPSNMNIADLLSRGCTPQKMLDSKWWEGPRWLRNNREQWPANEINCEPKDVILEKRKSELVNVNISEELVPWYAVRFSKYNSIVRLMGWILSFINNSRVHVEERELSELSSDDIENAERVLIRLVQDKMFPNLKSIPIVNVFKDNEGIIRVKTKITERKDDPNFIAPILMPSKCLLTTRLIEYYHLKHCHAGVQILMSILREKFWIMKTRKTVREVVMKCVPCRRYSSNSPMSEPVSLPADRVKDANAFNITGIDLAGPLFTRDGGKVWIVLYTCAIYRAIHLELVSSLSTECFMLSLRRFIARRTRPDTIYTDNGTNFVGTNSELKNLDWDKIMKETDIKPIKWKFNPPTAAWWGGWWERLVRVIKELLKRTLGKAILTYEELLTVICDCEAVVNSRPLTYVSEDPNDLIPLTPSLFLNGKSSYDTVDLDLSEFSKFQKRIKYRRKLIHDFRSRFMKEYLGQLRQKRPGKPGHDFKVGDVVMIEEPSKKRVYWPLGKVISLLPGRDGKVRTLKLKCKNSELIRPIQRVYPLEVPFINNEIVKIDGVPTSSVNEDKLTSNAVIKNKVTRSGRLVKIPERLGLFNEVLYAFE
ncbi:putative RNA-directed DNA polymerase from transposon X-element [Trichonephila clavipes]|nr:putative RNA-directed DNA polymerase from transposon X-element [Trichonephila clavipes]